MPTRVLFFGRLKDAAGVGERIVEIVDGERSIDALIKRLAAGDDALAAALAHPSVKVAIDQRVVDRATLIGAAREIAFLPPFSGG